MIINGKVTRELSNYVKESRRIHAPTISSIKVSKGGLIAKLKQGARKCRALVFAILPLSVHISMHSMLRTRVTGATRNTTLAGAKPHAARNLAPALFGRSHLSYLRGTQQLFNWYRAELARGNVVPSIPVHLCGPQRLPQREVK